MRRATNADRNLVVDILVSAFEPLEDDNSINFIVRKDKKRLKRLNLLMGYLFDRAMLYGEIFISDNDNACILFNYSNQVKSSWKSIKLDINLAINCLGIGRVFKVIKRINISKSYLPQDDHIRIIIGGSNAASNGNGTAARLMLEIVKEFKGNTLPVITDASNPDNVKLYEKLGFQQIGIEESLGYPIYYLRLN